MDIPRRNFITNLSGAAAVSLVVPNAGAKDHEQPSANDAGLEQSLVAHGSFRTFVNSAGKGNGPAVLLLHGSGPGSSAWSNWQFAVPFLRDRFYAIAPDLAGFGRSHPPKPYPQDVKGWMKHWTDQIFSLLDHLKAEKVHLIGNSMGGAVALHLLMRRPERFGKVVLMGSVGVPMALTPELDAIWGFFEDPSEERLRQVTGWFAYSDEVVNKYNEIAKARFDAAMVPEIRSAFSAMFPAPRQRHLDAIVVPGAALRRMHHPALIIHGRDDRIIPLQGSYDLVQAWGGPVQLHVYGRCGHWTQIEFRDSFNTLVRTFFDDRLT